MAPPPGPEANVSWLAQFWRSSVGAKVTMAITGVILFGFAVVHTLGNFQVFLEPSFMNDYSKMLHGMPELLWTIRLTLLVALVLHVASFLRLQQLTGGARPVRYKQLQHGRSTWMSRTMRISGVIVLAYLVLHILHLTTGTIHPDFRMQDAHTPEAYHNLTTGLAVTWMGIVYVVCNLLLGMHLWHGAYSLFKTLGLSGGRQLVVARVVATALTVLVAGGNVLIASSILLGLVK
jgi:succinate dehydrogenase / fumarate reductase cytochrome b subunit